MNHFVSGIIKIVFLEASIALLLIDRLVEGKWERQRLWAARILALLMVFAWCNFGGLRGNFGIVHEWEQFHFYLGAKYQKEVGWFDLYKAAIIADRESTHVLDRMTQTRDISTFEVVSVDQALADAPRVRARFSDQRWADFKEDWRRMLVTSPGIGWDRILMDHGNSNSPAWALIAHPIAELFPIDRTNQTFIGLIDIILMAIMWWFIFKEFGARPALIGLLVWAAMPIVFDYLSGSFLRWDWLFCLGMAMVMIKREKWATAGAFFGFAVATKLFPVFFGVALGIRAAYVYLREKQIPVRYRRFFVGAAASGVASVLLSAAMFGGFWCWAEYKQRIDVARDEKFYSIQYSLQTIYLQLTNRSAGNNNDVRGPDARGNAEEATVAFDTYAQRNHPGLLLGAKADLGHGSGPYKVNDAWMQDYRADDGKQTTLVTAPTGTFILLSPSASVVELIKSAGIFPGEIKQARNDVDIRSQSAGFFVFKLLFTLLVVILICRADDLQAFTLGPLLVFIWLIVNMYYWNMLGLMALGLFLRKERPALGALIALQAIFIVHYLYVHLNRGFTEGYAIAVMFAVGLITWAAFEWREVKEQITGLLGVKPAVAATPPARAP